jgi:hypothetical protein
MQHLITIVLMTIGAQGAYVCMGEKMVFERLGTLLSKVPEPWRHPLRSCPRCMVSVWGTGLCWALGALPENLFVLPVLWICAAGLGDLIDR